MNPQAQAVLTMNEWKNESNTVEKFSFAENVGMKVDIVGSEPIDVFNLFLTEEIISIMVNKTNKYAEQELEKKRPLRRSSRFHKWVPVNQNEMKLFLGLLLHMGRVKLPTMEHYWSSSSIYKFPFFSKIMSRNRFHLLLRFWSFSDNESIEKGRLSKVKLLLDHLNDTMREIYVPDKDLSLDVWMMLWRGRLIFRQYIKNKRHKYGVKFYELCESDGIVLRVSIYLGVPYQDIHGLRQTGAMKLNGGFSGKRIFRIY